MLKQENKIAGRDQKYQTSQLPCDADLAFRVFNWVSFSFPCCYSFAFMPDHYIISRQCWPTSSSEKITDEKFLGLLLTIPQKAPLSLYFQLACSSWTSEWRFSTFCFVLFPDKRAESTNHRKLFVVSFPLIIITLRLLYVSALLWGKITK